MLSGRRSNLCLNDQDFEKNNLYVLCARSNGVGTKGVGGTLTLFACSSP
jgi:hypothetical protein